jgi:membrane protein
MGQFIDLIRMTIKQWTHDKVSLLGAAVAFYMVFSLAPMLIIAIRIAGAVFGQQAAEGQIVEHAREIIGQAGAEAVQLIIRNASQTQLGTAGTIFTVVLLVVASTTFFTQLQSALNTVWNVEQKPREIPGTVQHVLVRRLIGLLLVFAFSLLLILSMLTSAVLSSLQNSVDITFPGGQLFWQFINFGISLAVITVMIGVTYKTLPDIKIQWRDVWIGAAVTALLFAIGNLAIGRYLASSSLVSTYGAAGSFVALLLWVYYSAQIYFFGAEITQIYASQFGHGIEPEDHAQFVPDAPAQQEQHSSAD